MLVGVLALMAALVSRPAPSAPASAEPSPLPAAATVVAVGDIGYCDGGNDERVAILADRLPGTILLLGDIAYPSGRAVDFEECFDPAWMNLRERFLPVPGNHEYESEGAGPYFAAFGDLAGTPGEGWYSTELGAWHVVALNSNCAAVGCDSSSSQARWLRDDLAAHPATCTLAFTHVPRWSSGVHGNAEEMADLWAILHEAGVDVMVTGHDHDYERLAPMDAAGSADPDAGVRQFVAGTGGREINPFAEILPTSEARNDISFGVLQLDLEADAYRWQFVPIDGDGFTDAGEGVCH